MTEIIKLLDTTNQVSEPTRTLSAVPTPNDRPEKSRKRFPMPPYPSGWFVVATSAEVKKGKIKSVSLLGNDLVIFRGEDGKIAVSDAYCPHLGAHLGRGCVKGNNISCPFHAWQFDQNGNCAEIPNAERIPKASLDIWPSAEKNNQIFMYYHPERLPPKEKPPTPSELDTAQWSTLSFGKPFNVKTHIQELTENSADLAHFDVVHTLGAPIPTYEFTETRWIATQKMQYSSFGIDWDFVLENEHAGLGNVILRAAFKRFNMIAYLSKTPVDEDNVQVQISIAIKSRYFQRLGKLILIPIYLRYFKYEFAKDIPLWEEKIYLDKPILSSADGPIIKFRRWAKNFYVD